MGRVSKGVRDLGVGSLHRVVPDGDTWISYRNERYVEAEALTKEETEKVMKRAGKKFTSFVDTAKELLEEYNIEGEPVTVADADGSVTSVIEIIFSLGRSGLLQIYVSQRVVDMTGRVYFHKFLIYSGSARDKDVLSGLYGPHRVTYILDLALLKDTKANVAEGLVIQLAKEIFGVILCAQWPACFVPKAWTLRQIRVIKALPAGDVLEDVLSLEEGTVMPGFKADKTARGCMAEGPEKIKHVARCMPGGPEAHRERSMPGGLEAHRERAAAGGGCPKGGDKDPDPHLKLSVEGGGCPRGGTAGDGRQALAGACGFQALRYVDALYQAGNRQFFCELDEDPTSPKVACWISPSKPYDLNNVEREGASGELVSVLEHPQYHCAGDFYVLTNRGPFNAFDVATAMGFKFVPNPMARSNPSGVAARAARARRTVEKQKKKQQKQKKKQRPAVARRSTRLNPGLAPRRSPRSV